jgi:uncharacterized protein
MKDSDDLEPVRGRTPQAVLRADASTIRRIAAQHGARRVRAFGSGARGTGTPASDLDLLIELAPGRSLLDLIAIEQDLEDALGLEVQAVSEAGLHPMLRERILAEAVPV